MSEGLIFEVNEDGTSVSLVGIHATDLKTISVPTQVASGSDTYTVTTLKNLAGGGAFTDSSVESLFLPETIKAIDDEALKGVPSLKHVQVSPKCEGFSSLDGMLFTKDYSHLLLIPEGKEGAIAIPGSTTHVSAQALSLCQSGSSLTTGDGGTAFASHDRMLFSKDLKTLVAVPPAYGTAIVLPTETETIGAYALAGCKDLASIMVLGNIQKIDPTAFADEVKASAVVALPAGNDYEALKSVWENAGFQHFAEPAQPGATTNPDTNEAASGLTYTLLDDYTLSVSWQGKDDPASELEIPASAEINGVPYRVSTIAENAFANRGSLTSVELPTTITTISTAAFAGCANLATIEFPNTLGTIGERAFEATSLKDVWLSESINSIGSRAFASCSTLERVVALGTPEVATDALAGCTNVSLYIPSGSEDSWNPGLPSDNNHLMPYGITLSEEPLAIEAGQEADLLEGGNLQAPDPVEASYSYAAAPLSVDSGTVSAKKAGTSDVTAVLTLNDVELARASRSVEVSPNPDAEADIVQLNSEVSLPSTYLADLRAASAPISVDAPFAATFGLDAPYDVKEPPTSMEASAKFTNNMDIPLQLAKITCLDHNFSNVLANDGGPGLMYQKLFSLYPQGVPEQVVDFGYESTINDQRPTDPSAFTIPPKDSAFYTFRLNLAKAKVNSGIADAGITTQNLTTVMCTFENSSFYLKDKASGRIYGLTEVKKHANDISANKENSPYWKQYQGYLADDTTYTCQTVWDGTPYDVRIIGVYHDIKTDESRAGLTFQFKNLLNTNYLMNSTATSAGGWGQSQLRANMNPNTLPNISGINGEDTNIIWNMVPYDLQTSIEIVQKSYGTVNSNDNESNMSISGDKLFIASWFELTGTPFTQYTNWAAAMTCLTKEGTPYEYWNGKATQNGKENEALVKFRQTNSPRAYPWWTRSLSPASSISFISVNSEGISTGGTSGNSGTWYHVCPCFCL